VGNDSVNTRIAPFEPQLLDRLIVLSRFGRDFLDESEFLNLWDHCERDYLRLLVQHKVQGTGAEFWAYHKRGQDTIGYNPPKGRLLVAALAELLRLLRHPKALLAAANARIRAMGAAKSLT
jgi:hypothetical protein